MKRPSLFDLGLGLLALMVSACAASKPAPEAPKAAAAETGNFPQGAYPSAAPPPPAPGTPAASTGYPTQPAMSSQMLASREIEVAQRELDVAAGDCFNACRALSSMDRAAGRLCGLSSGSEDDAKRCSDAKTRVYSARDKVKSSCGQCADTSVDKNAPVPSR